jgi:UDPglucose 6-dehydrogenase
MADLCEAVGADVQEVARGMGLDNRIGPKFLHAGPGYGGSCFPKDTTALVTTAEEHGVTLSIVAAVVDANRRRKESMAGRVIAALGGSAEGMTVAVLGLTFKPNTDDMRDAPSLDLSRASRGPARQSAPSTPRAWRPRPRSSPPSIWRRTPIPAPKTPMRWCS